MNSSDWTALIALAPAGLRKSRLCCLSVTQRDALAGAMHARVLAACARAGLRARVVEGHGGMNVDLADAHAMVFGGALVLPSDLPLISADDIAALIKAAPAAAADRHGTGTNAVALPAGFAFRFAFGPGSLARHLDQGLARVETDTLALDVDTMEDLDLARARGFDWRT